MYDRERAAITLISTFVFIIAPFVITAIVVLGGRVQGV